MSLQKKFSRADRFCPTLLTSSDFDEHVHTNLELKTNLRMFKSNHPVSFWSKNTNEKIAHFAKFLSFLCFEKKATVDLQMSLQKNISRADRFCPTLLTSVNFDERVHTNLKLKTSLRVLKSNHPCTFWSKNTNEKIAHFVKFLIFFML